MEWLLELLLLLMARFDGIVRLRMEADQPSGRPKTGCQQEKQFQQSKAEKVPKVCKKENWFTLRRCNQKL
jgi:hypothetical protein